jgi:hypothetical protein
MRTMLILWLTVLSSGCLSTPRQQRDAFKAAAISPEEAAALFQRFDSEQTAFAKPSRQQLHAIILSDADNELRQRAMRMVADEKSPENIGFYAHILTTHTKQCSSLYEYAIHSLVLIHDRRAADAALDFIESPAVGCEPLKRLVGLKLASSYTGEGEIFQEIHERLRSRDLSTEQACSYLYALAGYSIAQGRKVDPAIVRPYLDAPSLSVFGGAVLALSVGGYPDYLERLEPYVNRERGIEGVDFACDIIHAHRGYGFLRKRECDPGESSGPRRMSQDWYNNSEINWFRKEMAKRTAATTDQSAESDRSVEEAR